MERTYVSYAEQQKRQGLGAYVERMVCHERIRNGLNKLDEQKAVLEQISAAHGVPWQLLMAIWGIETNYGSYMGEHDVLTVLAHEAFQLQGTPLGDYIQRLVLCSLQAIGISLQCKCSMPGNIHSQ